MTQNKVSLRGFKATRPKNERFWDENSGVEKFPPLAFKTASKPVSKLVSCFLPLPMSFETVVKC